MSPSSSSLPDDRSLWPSFLSGGSLPKADETAPVTNGSVHTSAASYPSHPVSSSVPAPEMAGSSHRASSTGPRLHDYSIPPSTTASGGITQLRPGLLGVPTGPQSSMPVPVPNNGHTTSDSLRGYRSATSATSDSWASSPYENGHASSYVSAGLSSGSLPFVHSDERSASTGGGGWSLPRSSLRSVSSQSRSRSGSASGSRSDDESVVDVDGELDDFASSKYAGRYGYNGRQHMSTTWKREEDEMSVGFSVREEDEDDEAAIGGAPAGIRKEPEWDGLEMEMDMD